MLFTLDSRRLVLASRVVLQVLLHQQTLGHKKIDLEFDKVGPCACLTACLRDRLCLIPLLLLLRDGRESGSRS